MSKYLTVSGSTGRPKVSRYPIRLAISKPKGRCAKKPAATATTTTITANSTGSLTKSAIKVMRGPIIKASPARPILAAAKTR